MFTGIARLGLRRGREEHGHRNADQPTPPRTDSELNELDHPSPATMSRARGPEGSRYSGCVDRLLG